MGLLLPVRVDAASGDRFYGVDQLERARLGAALRQLGVPLVEIKTILDLGPEEAARRIADYWETAETYHSTRRDLPLPHRQSQRKEIEHVRGANT
jgi:protein phosphatase